MFLISKQGNPNTESVSLIEKNVHMYTILIALSKQNYKFSWHCVHIQTVLMALCIYLHSFHGTALIMVETVSNKVDRRFALFSQC